MGAGLRDLARMATRRVPYTIPIIAEPHEFAALNTPDSRRGYTRLVPSAIPMENFCPARICLTLPWYRPCAGVHKISCPVLLIAAKRDTLIPHGVVSRAASRISDCEFHTLDCGHFDVYVDEMFRGNLAIQRKFLIKCQEQ